MKHKYIFMPLLLLAICAGAFSSEHDSDPVPKKGSDQDQHEEPAPTPEEEGKDAPVPHDMYISNGSLINSYVDAEKLDVSLSDNGKDIVVYCVGDCVYSRLLGEEWQWWHQVVSGTAPTEQMYARFETLATENKDAGFNGFIPVYIRYDGLNVGDTNLSQPISSIEVTSSAAWDEEHPAGTPLNDMIRIFSPRYAEVFDSGYELLYRNWGHADEAEREQYPPRQDFGTEYSSRDAAWKLLTELDETDKRIFPAYFVLKSLPYLPLFGQQITVKVTLADGTVLTGTCRE